MDDDLLKYQIIPNLEVLVSIKLALAEYYHKKNTGQDITLGNVVKAFVAPLDKDWWKVVVLTTTSGWSTLRLPRHRGLEYYSDLDNIDGFDLYGFEL